MANFKLNVNTDANIILTAKLERLRKSSFPSAVRSTLSDAAFEMKKTNIRESAENNMKVRNPTVFKKFTGVKRANGFNVNSMYAEVGFIPKDGIKGDKIPEGMENNEVGGTDDTGWMYMPKTRTSGSKSRGLVRRNARFDRNKNLSRQRNGKGGFISNAYRSKKEKKPFDLKTSKGSFLVIATSFEKSDSGIPNIKLDFLMRERKNFKARAKATHFNKEAAIKTSKQIDDFYKKNFDFQMNKFWR